MARILNSGAFKSEVQNSKGVVIVDFFATWCAPCKMLTPVFEGASKEMGRKVKFAKVDVDKSLQIAKKYNVTSLPTLIIFKNGKAVDRMVGFTTKKKIVNKLETYL